jgi:hypothetical protein
MDRIDIYPRQDPCCPERLANFRVSLHAEDGGELGVQNWSADLFTDGTNAGSGEGTLVTVAKADGTGDPHGRWFRILALDDPVPDYFLQLTEIEVYGTSSAVIPPTISITATASGIVVTYATGVLESAASLNAGFNPVPGATSPYPVTTDLAQRYYRVSQ